MDTKTRISKTLTFLGLFLGLLASQNSRAYDKIDRLGVGLSNELKNDISSLSFKIQKNRTFALGGLVGISSNQKTGGYGAGLKFYRNIFDEPQLNFYMTGMAALLSKKINDTTNSGFQIDAGLGTEFHFTGLNSIGFSFEFGMSANKVQNFSFETMGGSYLVSGVHFYL